MNSHRQTVSYLRQRFGEVGINPDTRHGQNFLVDLNLVDVLVKAADVGPNDVVLEAGTGTGSLTSRLADLAAAVITVEIDPRLYQMASEELVGRDNVTMLHHDVLRNKNNLDHRVVEAVQRAVSNDCDRGFKLVANLPYNIATPLITNLLVSKTVPDSMTVTIQKELADRIAATHGNKLYGALSVWVQSLCDVRLVRVMPPSVFWPRPKVHSAILRIDSCSRKRASIPDLAFYQGFVRSLFFHRRKFLRSVLISRFKKQLSKRDVDNLLSSAEIAPDSRAEQLDIETVQSLAEHFRARIQGLDE